MPGVSILMLSSGTTGAPKRIPLAFASLEKAVLGAAFCEGESGEPGAMKLKDSVAFAFVPLVHIGGVRMALRAGSAPLDPALSQAFEERHGIPILDAYGATEFTGGVAGWTWSDHKKFGAQNALRRAFKLPQNPG